MRKIAVVLCGKGNSGKTKTLNKFKKLYLVPKNNKHSFVGIIDGIKIVYVYTGSLQEWTYTRPNKWKRVIKELKKQLEPCESFGDDFIVFLTFNIHRVGRNRLNSESIIKPLEKLRQLGYKVKPVYLRKQSNMLGQIDNLMRRVRAKVIESRRGQYIRQAKELMSFV